MATTAKSTAAKSASTKVVRVRKAYDLTQPKFARVMGISVRRLAALEQGVKPTENVQRRITEVERLRRALAKVVKADAIGDWMDRPNKAFGGRRPIQVIEDGEIDLLWAMIHDLQSGDIS